MSQDGTDDITKLLFVELPAAQIVFIHALLEGYDGLAQVKTLDTKRSLLLLIATQDTANDCERVLESLRPEVAWRFVDCPDQFEEMFEYARNNQS